MDDLIKKRSVQEQLIIAKTLLESVLSDLPSIQREEAVPHRNYKYLSDYWCECGNHLGKKGDVKYCSDCGKKVKWDE